MKSLMQSLRFLVFATLAFGVIYPLIVWLAGLVIFPTFKPELMIGQEFTSPAYFWGRPSQNSYATSPAEPTNLSPTSKTLKKQIDERLETLLKYHPEKTLLDIPEPLLMGSASGIDPDLPLESVLFQFDRVVKARKLSKESAAKLRELIELQSRKPLFGFSGSERLNIYQLNKALDELSPPVVRTK